MTISYDEHLKDRFEMPVFDESIFHPERELYKLGLNDEDIECLVQFFKWHLEQRNRRLNLQHIIAILKLRMEKLIHQKKLELAREVEALQNFSRSFKSAEALHLGGLEKFQSLTPALYF